MTTPCMPLLIPWYQRVQLRVWLGVQRGGATLKLVTTWLMAPDRITTQRVPTPMRLPLAVTASRLDADPNATSTGVVVMLCFMKPMFLAVTSANLNTLMTRSSQAVANAELSALNASPPTLSV